jgi:hypothetical protein
VKKGHEHALLRGMNTENISRQDRQIGSQIQLLQTVRVRPFDTKYSEDVCKTADISENGLYFETSLGHYHEGMNVSLARNFPPAGQTHHEETAKIVRTERLSDGKWGVAIRIL